MLPVAIFARVSSDQQNYERQINDLQQLVREYNYQVVATITEVGSASKRSAAQRPEVDQLLQLARTHKIRKVLVTEMSRIGRRPKDTREIIENLMDLGVSVYAHNLGLETMLPNGKRNPMANIVMKVLEEVDWMETERLSDRIRSGKRNSKITQGRPIGSSKTPKQYIKEYPAVVTLLKSKISIRKINKLTNTPTATIQLVKKALASIEKKEMLGRTGSNDIV